MNITLLNPAPAHRGGRYAIVAAQFNRKITELLLAGAEKSLRENGAANLDIAWVPGAFEIPQACKKLAGARDYDAIIALGAVIRGETPHFDYVAAACARGIARLNLRGDTPVIFGVLTTDTPAQALARADPQRGDKGGDAARAALAMTALFARL